MLQVTLTIAVFLQVVLALPATTLAGVQTDPTQKAALPDYLHSSTLVERPIVISSENLNLPGNLVLPDSFGATFPAVVFIHGSGPNDRDETVGSTKPFRDLAYGLAKHGIASVRYDKRTRLTPMVKTIEDEVIVDAVSALNFVRRQPEIDSSQIFIVGHSLGGTLAPFIAQQVAWLKGIIVVAGLAVPIDSTILRQVKQMGKIQGLDSVTIAIQLQEISKGFRRARTGELPDDSVFFFAPGSYWRSLFAISAPDTAARFPGRLLFVQGGRDIQVLADVDYPRWQQALTKTKKKFEGKIYPSLNHLLVSGSTPSTGMEYFQPGYVDRELIDDLANWIKGKPTKPE